MPASPASVKPHPSRSTAHVSARSASMGNSRRYSRQLLSKPCRSTKGAFASPPAGAGEPTQLVMTGLARPGTSTETCFARRAISIAAGSSSAVTSSGKNDANSERAAARTTSAPRTARRRGRDAPRGATAAAGDARARVEGAIGTDNRKDSWQAKKKENLFLKTTFLIRKPPANNSGDASLRRHLRGTFAEALRNLAVRLYFASPPSALAPLSVRAKRPTAPQRPA